MLTAQQLQSIMPAIPAAKREALLPFLQRINGGFNGLEDRRKFYGAACAALGVARVTVMRGSTCGFADGDNEPEFERGAEAIRRRGRKSRTTKKKKKPRAR